MLRKIKSVYRLWSVVYSRRILLSVLSAALLALPFFSARFSLLSWVGFVPLFFALRNKTKTGAFLLGYLCGLIFWFSTIYWLIHVTLAGMIILVLYLALYFGIFGLIVATITHRPERSKAEPSRRGSTIDCFSISFLWILLEYIRSHLLTGFPWALLGYSQSLNLPLIQIADITGAWGLSFIIILVNAGIYWFIKRVAPLKNMLLVLLSLAVVLSYGYYKLHQEYSSARAERAAIKISVIQPNIPQGLKWNPDASDLIIFKHMELSRQAMPDEPDLIIWPEASFPSLVMAGNDDFRKFKGWLKSENNNFLFGAVRLDEGEYFNSAVLSAKNKDAFEYYNKIHLVPFGEYIPLKSFFRFLETIVPIGDFSFGREYTVFRLKDYLSSRGQESKFSVLVCFEDAFCGLSRKFTLLGAQFIVNITNDAWFGKTSAAYQHLQCSILRAVENRRAVARSANTGVSCFISPAGRLISQVIDSRGENIFIVGHNTAVIELNNRLSIYTRFGDWFILAGVLYLGLFFLSFFLRLHMHDNIR